MRLGIVGCGLIGQKRATAAKGHEVVLVADLDTARAQALAGKTGAQVAQDWQALLAADLDVVIIATTHGSLAPIAIAALEAGKHVLVEKPAGMDVEEVAKVAVAATKAGKLCKVGFNHRFHPALWKAKEIADSGALGPMMFLRGRYGHGGRLGMEKEWRAIPELSGGGELIDQGSHLIDLSRWFLGDLELAFAATPTLFWDMKVDDNCFLALKNGTGNIAWLHASWSEWKNMFSLEIYGRDGKLMIDGLGGSYGPEKLTWFKMLPQMGPPETTVFDFSGPDLSWDAEFADFADSIASGRRATGDIEDALAMHKIIAAAYQGAQP
ncbi:MAG: Gfo/Idh/MocA family oxidoreductase [Alphaproteobacteria bacterium]|nr:Gfo/Idh/MocA family oxidoreductase [Alphaproteobacteria bacterium]